MSRHTFGIAFLYAVSALLLSTILLPSDLHGDPLDQQKISADAVAALRNDFALSELITLVQNSPTRSSSRRYLQEQQFHSAGTQLWGQMVHDGYVTEDPKSLIISYTLAYDGTDGPLTIVDAYFNPMNTAAKERLSDLLRRSLSSVSNPDGSSQHFLGIYDLDSKRILKIMIRKAKALGPDFTIRYGVFYR